MPSIWVKHVDELVDKQGALRDDLIEVESSNFKEGMTSVDRGGWLKSMHIKMHSLVKGQSCAMRERLGEVSGKLLRSGVSCKACA